MKLEVPPLPEGPLHSATVHKRHIRGNGYVCFVEVKGVVYTTKWRDLELVNCTQAVLRFYASVAKVKFKDLVAAVKAERKRQDEVRRSEEFEDLARTASQLGYELRRIA